MPRETFNGGASAAAQRKAFYASDAAPNPYVEIIEADPHQAIQVGPEGGEIHYDDGSRVFLGANDWVVEGFDGELRRLPADLFAAHYSIVGHKGLPRDVVAQRRRDPDEYEVDAAELVVDTLEDEQIPTVDRTADDLARERAAIEDPAPDANRHDPTPLEEALALLDAGRGDELTAAHKNALQTEMVIAEERRVEALQTVIDAARRHKLVDENEAKAWEDTGTAPDGMSVTAHDDGYTLERQGEKVDTRPSGAEDTASDGAAPSSPSEPADLGKARAKRRR